MRKIILALFLLLLLVSTAYAGDLEEISENGVLRLGVFPGAVPFVFYDDNDELTGIDIKLMEEIAQRMDLDLEVSDMSADSLQESLEIGQIDVIGGAFSKTNERKKVMDFSKIYYSARPVFVGRARLSLPKPLSAESFADLKIGVQKGNALEEWLKTDLVDKDAVRLQDIYTYTALEDAMRALDRGKIDLFLTDADVFGFLYPDVSDYNTWSYGNAKDNYAFAVCLDSDLKNEINKHLSDLLTDGTAQQIADAFFSGEYDSSATIRPGAKKPAPTVTSIPTLALPTQIPTPAKCTNVMEYIQDITIPDGMKISAGTAFTKIWRVRNTGTCTWTPAYTFNFVKGDRMDGWNQALPRNVYPGETIDISVDMVSPNSSGNYRGDWQLMTPEGYAIGIAIWAQINVPGGGGGGGYAPTAVPTLEPVQQGLPAKILYYYPNFYTQEVGKCVNLYWGVDDNSTAELFVDGKSVYFGSESQNMIQICDEVLDFGPHYIELCAYGVAGDDCETVIYTTDPAGTPFSP